MCLLCGDLVGEPHWTERIVQGGQICSFAGESNRRQARFRRTRMLNRVLRAHTLSVHADLSSTNYILANAKGWQEVVQHLGQMWTAADLLAGNSLDIVDARLAADLE